MTKWIDTQLKRAEGDTQAHLDQIKGWQERAQAVASEATHNGTKQAVEQCPPEDEEARAIYHLYALHAETIYHVCRAALEQTAETDAVELEDVLQEAYPLFQRCLVSYDPDRGALDLYLANALKRRIQIYLGSKSHETTDSDQEVADQARVAPGYDLVGIYEELVAENRVPSAAASLFDRVHPDRES